MSFVFCSFLFRRFDLKSNADIFNNFFLGNRKSNIVIKTEKKLDRMECKPNGGFSNNAGNNIKKTVD